MQTKQCPSCKEYLEPIWFQPPVRTCLYCYARLPRNRDMWATIESKDPIAAPEAWKRVRARAIHAPYANKMIHSKRMLHRDMLQDGVVPPATFTSSSSTASADSTMGACDGCNKNFEIRLLSDLTLAPGPDDGPKPLVCPTCKENATVIDHKCALCQKMFPLTALASDGSKLHCVDCVAKLEGGPAKAVR